MMRGCYLPALLPLLLQSATATAEPAGPEIIDWPIHFDDHRKTLTLRYIKQHYGLEVESIKIRPKAVVIHWTSTRGLKSTWARFNRVTVDPRRRRLSRGGPLNVSAHFLVARDGRIFRLMPETWMARHCIGLNYDSIGIENMGGGPAAPLTRAQLEANAALVRTLTERHPIRYLLGHFEVKRFERAPIFRELDPKYRSAKVDPGPRFMRHLRARLQDLDLLAAFPQRPATN
jgi:N-acetylmuramoyl-L-alanine amidase